MGFNSAFKGLNANVLQCAGNTGTLWNTGIQNRKPAFIVISANHSCLSQSQLILFWRCGWLLHTQP